MKHRLKFAVGNLCDLEEDLNNFEFLIIEQSEQTVYYKLFVENEYIEAISLHGCYCSFSGNFEDFRNWLKDKDFDFARVD